MNENRKTTKRDFKSFDFLLVAIVCGLAIFGIIVIGGATDTTLGGSVENYYEKQKFWFISGVILLLLAAFIDYRFICRFYILIYLVNLILLIVVFFVVDISGTGTDRWIRFNGVGIQPSEFAKIFMIIFLSRFLDVKNESFNRPYMLMLTAGLVITPVVLIIRQPALSAALVVAAASVTVLFIGMISYKYVLPTIAVGVPITILTFWDLNSPDRLFIDKILSPYQIKRIMLWLHPDVDDPKYYKTMQSIKAIASGQFEGRGIDQGVINLPMAHNDFIFAVIGEEMGFIGCMAVLAVMLLVVLKCLFIAQKAVDTTGKLIASGVAAMLAFQTFVNVCVATGMLPNTGMPLPFISYGGSSMWVSMVAIGLCVNIGMTRTKSFFEG